MAAVAVLAELKFRDGQREKIRVKVENNLSSLISGINEMNVNVSQLLSELVEQEKTHGVCAEGELMLLLPAFTSSGRAAVRRPLLLSEMFAICQLFYF